MFLVLCKAKGTVRTPSIYIEVGCLQATGLAPLNLLRKHSHGEGGSHRKYTILVQQGHLVIYSSCTELPSPNTNAKKKKKESQNT